MNLDHGSLRLVEAAADFSDDWIAEAREACRVDGAADDVEIKRKLRVAFEWLQPPTGVLFKSVLKQKLRFGIPNFSGDPQRLFAPIELPAGPVSEILSIKYSDADNAEQTLDPSTYFQDDDWVLFTNTFADPDTYARPNAVRIEYYAGVATAADIPIGLKEAIFLITGHLFENRGDDGSAPDIDSVPGVADLIRPHRFRA